MRTRKSRRRARERARKLRAFGFKASIVLLVVLILTGIALMLGVLRMRPGFSDGDVRFYWENDELWVSWPSMGEGDRCQVSVFDSDKKSYILIDELSENEITLSGIKEGSPVQLRLQAVGMVDGLFGKSREVKGEKKDLDVVPVSVKTPEIAENANVEKQTMTLQWVTDSSEYYEIYLLDENKEWRFHAKTSEGWFNLDFANNLELPDRNDPIQVSVRACYEQNDGVFYSKMADAAVVERKELMPEYVTVSWEKTANSIYRLSWEESIGDLYEVQQWSYEKGAWEKVTVVNWNDPLEYEIGKIPSSRNSRYRVITYNADTEADKQAAFAEPGIVNFWSDLSPQYCTIWPIIELDLYADSSAGESLLKIPEGEALCVLGEENGHFQVMYNNTIGYIDSNYCLINLPEYLGDLCKYEIANSYSSIFRVHEYDIPNVTDGVVQGYENIRLVTDEYLVPYLYPCSQKLRQAAENCLADGYCLKIYDAFRPNEATRFLYDTAMTILDYPVPQVTVIGEEDESSQEDGSESTQTDSSVSPDPLQSADPSVSDNSIPQIDRYGDLIPEALTKLAEMTPEDLALIGLTPETVTAVSTCSAESLIYLKSMTYETLSMIQAGVFDLEDEMFWYTQQIAAALAASVSDNSVDGAEGETVSGNSADAVMAQQPVIRVDTSIMGIFIDAKGTGVEGLPLKDLLIWQSLPSDQLNAFKAYLENAVQTYYYVMTNDGRYRLGSFLAQVTSAHNRGIAVDLTLEKIDTGEEMPMQTSMHDLSWYSALVQNNENAELLASYMKGVGFNDLSSEWWHFQDDETRNALNLNAYLTEGLSIEGWKKNDTGWYYQLADGSYYKETSVEIDGKTYTFDEEGYCER